MCDTNCPMAGLKIKDQHYGQVQNYNLNQERRSGMTSERANTFFCRYFVLNILIICVVASLARTGYGDGKYFAEKAYKVPPDIPSQRAILIYKDGSEKLIIESALEAQGQEFGWIIPLPAKPTAGAMPGPFHDVRRSAIPRSSVRPPAGSLLHRYSV